MIRSSKVSIKFSNKKKLDEYNQVVDEYRNIVSYFVDLLWNEDKTTKFISKELTDKCNTWLSARMVQCAAKQARGIVFGTKKKQSQRLFIINKLKELGQFKKARKLHLLHSKLSAGRPIISEVCPELDGRFVNIDLENKTSFDGWLTLGSIGGRIKIQLPFKKTKHFNKLLIKGKLKNGVRLSKSGITFMFEMEEKQKHIGTTVGIDIGQKTLLSCSDGKVSGIDNHGHDLNSISDRLRRRKKGSMGFLRSANHRTNYINWSVNQLNFNEIYQVNLEKIKNLRCGKKSSRKLSHWNYREIQGRLEQKCEEHGVRVNYVSPTYTSQRCSSCGWVRKSNRNGKLFRCEKCSNERDADLNASVNLSLNLRPIGQKERLMRKNRIGFYWNVLGGENIVPHIQKT